MQHRRESPHEADAAAVPLAGHRSQPPRRLRRSTVSLGVVLLLVVLLGVASFLQAEMQLETAPASSGFLQSDIASAGGVGHALLRSDNASTGGIGYRLKTEYECVGYYRTGACSPDGPREPANDVDCKTKVLGGLSGYCVYRHKLTNETRRVLPMHCDSLREGSAITCDQAPDLYAYGEGADSYVHDAAFSQDDNQAAVLASFSSAQPKPSLKRGISIVVHESVLGSAYASVRNLRELSSTLPVEMWYRADETKPDHPILRELVAKHGVFLREIADPRATTFYTKLFAVFYSAFDSVLLLDADNFALKDPDYLFNTAEFNATGAVFWPDYWHPSTTIFNIQPRSLVWPIVGLDYVDMFEQESGQVLVDRRKHTKALDAMMYYATTQPRVFEDLNLAWGDKDLFRFAWMKTQSSFHFVSRPPGSVGMLESKKNQFCGLTMVQYDPQGEMVFLHRNMEKLRVTSEKRLVWTHVQEFKQGSPKKNYAMGWAHVFDKIGSCWGRVTDFTHYDIKPIDQFAFKDVEPRLVKYVEEAAALTR